MSDSLQLIDIGANLTHESFADDLEAVLDRAAANGVAEIIVTGADPRGSREAASLAASRDRLFATAGVHPHYARVCTVDTIAELRELAAGERVVAVGETGLDFNRDFSPRPVQQQWFAAQLELAVELQMPVFLHQRDAHDAFAAILGDYMDSLPGAVVHCFTDTAAALEHYLALGCHVGITGWICDERRGDGLRELVRLIPDDRLLIETDAPYLLPRDLSPRPSGRRNEPAYLAHVAQAVADARGQTLEQVAMISRRNAIHCFRLPIQ